MSNRKTNPSRSSFENAVGYVLISGVVLSLILEIAGMASFYQSFGRLDVSGKKEAFIHGQNFFDYAVTLLRGGYGEERGILLMSLGIVILILTPYARVVLSVLHFARKKDLKYVVITTFVLFLLTLSLAVS